MSILTADGALQSYLSPLKEPTEIRAPDGNVIGYFTPVAQVVEKSIRDLFDPAELRRRKALKQKSYTIEEVRTHLAGLATHEPERGQ
jgi:hypothetical protein